MATPLLISSILLFYIGVAFAYFLVFPLIFAFLSAATPDGVAMMTDISAYLDFVLALFFAFGIAFEIPIATILVVAVGITTPADLVRVRPYVIVGAFVVGMLLTPPDVISQTLLAVPMWLLFELGISSPRCWCASARRRRTKTRIPTHRAVRLPPHARVPKDRPADRPRATSRLVRGRRSPRGRSGAIWIRTSTTRIAGSP